MSDLVYIPNEDTNFLSLSSGAAESLKLSRSVRGKLFKKHILSTGPLYYKGVSGGKIVVDDNMLQTIVRNFENKVCPIVQVPVVGDNNAHTEDPFRNIGEVVGLSVENGKLYSIIDARDEIAATKLGKTLIGASAMIALDRTDNRTGTKAGPTLLHVAITNNPHVNELDEFEELIAASSDDSSSAALLLSTVEETEENTVMDLDTLISVAREEHGIDIPALQRASAEAESFAKLSADLQDKLANSGVLKLSDSEETVSEDIVAAVASIVDTNIELSAKVETLVEESARAKAEARIDSLVAEGFITPAKREAQLNLLLTNAELFEELLPEQPIVELSAESGREIVDEAPDQTIEAEIARLTQDAATQGLTIKA